MIDDFEHPPDAFSFDPTIQRLRIQKHLPVTQHMTSSQIATYRNHDGSSSKYDMISIFSLHPPERLGVFTNPVDYFRLCHIDENNLKNEQITILLDDNLRKCKWIDCLGCQIRMRQLAKSEISNIVRSNLDWLTFKDCLDERENFNKTMNLMIQDLTNSNHLSEDEPTDFFYTDDNEILSVPVVSNTSPFNTQHF